MKTLLTTLIFTLISTQTFANKMECSIEERDAKTFQLIDYSPLTILENGKEITLKLKTGASLIVKSGQLCAADGGGHCSTNSVLSFILQAGDSLTSTESDDATPYLFLKVGNRSLKASCLPAIGE